MANAGAPPRGQMLAGLLRFRSENRIAATDVGQHGMRASVLIPQGDDVLLARASTIAIAGSGREEAAEDAMLGVEDRQVMIGDRFDPAGIELAGERGDLFGIEIVCRGEPVESRAQDKFARSGGSRRSD